MAEEIPFNITFSFVLIGCIVGALYGLYGMTSKNIRSLARYSAGLLLFFCLGQITKMLLNDIWPRPWHNKYFVIYNYLVLSILLGLATAIILMVFFYYKRRIDNLEKPRRPKKLNLLASIFRDGFLDFTNNAEQEEKRHAEILENKPVNTLNGGTNSRKDLEDISNFEVYSNDLFSEIELSKKINDYNKRLFASRYDAIAQDVKHLDHSSQLQAVESYLQQYCIAICKLEEIFEPGTARLRIKKNEEYTNTMRNYPSSAGFDTPLDKPSLVQLSLTTGMKPIRYIKQGGYFIEGDEIKNGTYDDCMVICLISKDNKPFLSLDLYIKGDKATQLLDYLIALDVIKEISLAISHIFGTIGKEFESQYSELQYCVL